MLKWLLFTFGVGCCSPDIPKNSYDDHTFFEIKPRNLGEMTIMMSFISRLSDSNEVDIFKRSRGPNDSTDVLVSPTKTAEVFAFLRKHEMDYQLKKHYGRLMDNSNTVDPYYLLKLNNSKLSADTEYNVFSYNSYKDMRKRIKTLASRHPKMVILEEFGQSYEGRKLTLVKISSKHRANNPVIFIDAGVHAREWVAPVMAMYIIGRLTSGARYELDDVDWYILPLVNPDGYEYSQKSPEHRLWRKSRSPTKEPGCHGVDLNRNYGFKWGLNGASKKQCHYTMFAGCKPFSEPETRIVRDIMEKYSKRIKLYVSIQSYGDYLIYPWGYTDDLPPRSKQLRELAMKISQTVSGAGGEPLTVMNAGKWYAAAGGSEDYAFGVVKIPFVYSLKITNDDQFSFPQRLLAISLARYYEGFKTFAEEIKRIFGNKRVLKLKSNTAKCPESVHLCNCFLGVCPH